jgi:hypothetical protein
VKAEAEIGASQGGLRISRNYQKVQKGEEGLYPKAFKGEWLYQCVGF